MIARSTSTFSSSRADDHAFLALGDVARITQDLEETRVVGGLMVMLLTEAFPARGFVTRRTADVDTAISVTLAHSGELHERLTGADYVASNGNRYVRDGRVIDLLVPSGTSKFGSAELGGRGFDAAPGLQLEHLRTLPGLRAALEGTGVLAPDLAQLIRGALLRAPARPGREPTR